jgi:hypothetical protein
VNAGALSRSARGSRSKRSSIPTFIGARAPTLKL